jgi:hypothetical protein
MCVLQEYTTEKIGNACVGSEVGIARFFLGRTYQNGKKYTR